ncbi:MAG: hypothetical protein RR420_01285 [Anaerovoracaceae bacterium]
MNNNLREFIELAFNPNSGLWGLMLIIGIILTGLMFMNGCPKSIKTTIRIIKKLVKKINNAQKAFREAV